MIKKSLLSALSILILSFVVFLIIYAVPGSFYNSGMLNGVTRERIEQLKMTENQSVICQYKNWVSDLLKGSLGISLSYKKPVTKVILEKLPKTIALSLLALIFELVFGLLASFCIVVYFRHSYLKRVSDFSNVFLLSVPVFVVGILLQKLFSYELKILPSSGFSALSYEDFDFLFYIDVFYHLLLPSLTLCIVSIGGFIKLMTSALEAEMSKPYILYAYSRGFSKWRIVSKYAFGNSKITFWWYIINSIPLLFGGAVVVEKLFAIDGLGNLAYTAAMSRDYPLLMGYTFIFGVLTFVCNFFGDILYKKVDKQITEV